MEDAMPGCLLQAHTHHIRGEQAVTSILVLYLQQLLLTATCSCCNHALFVTLLLHEFVASLPAQKASHTRF